jgi:hypothetical protein
LLKFLHGLINKDAKLTWELIWECLFLAYLCSRACARTQTRGERTHYTLRPDINSCYIYSIISYRWFGILWKTIIIV